MEIDTETGEVKLKKRTSCEVMKRAMMYLTTGMSMFCLEVTRMVEDQGIGNEEDVKFCDWLMKDIAKAGEIWEKLCPFKEEIKEEKQK